MTTFTSEDKEYYLTLETPRANLHSLEEDIKNIIKLKSILLS